jgi:hypothetical protein
LYFGFIDFPFRPFLASPVALRLGHAAKSFIARIYYQQYGSQAQCSDRNDFACR